MDKNNSQTLSSIKERFISELSKIYGKSEAESIFFIFIEDELGITKSSYLLQKESSIIGTRPFDVCLKKLLKNEPIQYIIGKQYFYGNYFKVNHNCLIPRAETEELVDLILRRESSQDLNVIDLGTGSGCISISLKRNRPNWNVYATDISPQTLNLAQQNSEELNAPVNFMQNDIFKENLGLEIKFDVIVSNPPYVKLSEKKMMRNNVLDYEPDIALFVENEDPLIFYKSIKKITSNALKAKGNLYFEINPFCAKELFDIFDQDETYTQVELITDSFGKPRFLHAQKN